VIASFRAEIIKQVRRPAIWIILAIAAALSLLFGYIIPYIIYTHPPQGVSAQDQADILKSMIPEGWLGNQIGGLALFGAAFCLILGVIVTGSEYGWNTIATILTQRPGRLAVLGGKLLALVLIAVVYEIVVVGPAAPASYIVARRLDAPMNWPSIPQFFGGVGAGLLLLCMWALGGAFLAILFRGTALAIGLGMVYLFVIENLITGFAGRLSVLKTIEKLLPGVNGGALISAVSNTSGNPGVDHVISATRGGITVAVYAAIFVIIATVVFRQRDVA
jgi:ABC-type transport system involved in multi-copper enzyme maturation permease subunit